MRCALLVAASLAAAILTSPRSAGAYCRETTQGVPPGYDPTATGCISQGVPLVWPSMPVTYQIERETTQQVTLDEVTPIVDRSVAKWAVAACPSEAAVVHPALSFSNRGATDAGYEPCDGSPCGFSVDDAPHVVIFRDQGWPYDDPAQTVALTTLYYGVESGHIFAADMEINSAQHTIVTTEPPPAGTYSLEAIVTHEAGHFIGLAHSQVDSAVMFAYYQPGAVSLTPDDIAGVCAAYPQSSGAQAGGCACAEPGSRAGGEGARGLLIAGVAAGLLAIRRPRYRARPR